MWGKIISIKQENMNIVWADVLLKNIFNCAAGKEPPYVFKIT